MDVHKGTDSSNKCHLSDLQHIFNECVVCANTLLASGNTTWQTGPSLALAKPPLWMHCRQLSARIALYIKTFQNICCLEEFRARAVLAALSPINAQNKYRHIRFEY